MNPRNYWRSFEELDQSEEFRQFAADEFVHRIPAEADAASRRKFLRLMGASMALAGATACTKQPKETIVPYVRQPEEIVPGNPLFYATTVTEAGLGTGLLVESHEGRPTKIEGNPDHPASLGATSPQMQASVLNLYDPDRSQTVLHDGIFDTWERFTAAFSGARDLAGLKKGEGLRILTGTVTSPTLAAQLAEFLEMFPQAKWHQWDPCGRHSDYAGSVAAFGAPWNTIYHFERAARIASFDADFLDPASPGGLRSTRDYTGRRRDAAQDPSSEFPRLYIAESTPSITGGMAEHRFRMRSREVESFADKLMSGNGDPYASIMKDLNAHRGESIVIAGEYQIPRVHALAHAMNQALGNTGKTVVYTDRVEANPMDQTASLAALAADMRAGAVETLLILGGNPVYDAPADLDFVGALQQVKLRAHLGLYANETAEWCHWHLPEAHYLESWSDARAWDGTASIVQPLIAPIYNGKTSHELLNLLLNRTDLSAHDTVRGFWQTQHKGADFEDFWQISLHDGVVAGTTFPDKTPPAANVPPASAAQQTAGIEIVFRPDPAVGSGADSNNGWLQELPKPPNKMTWENAVWISQATAQRLAIDTGDVVELALNGRKLQGAVWVQAGQADESAAIHFGYGRKRAGRVANGIGFNAYSVRDSKALWHGAGAEVKRISRGYSFATTQYTQNMEERDPFRVATIEEFRARPGFAQPEGEGVPPPNLTMFPMWQYPKHKWGMSIDLTACTGCNACMVACQAENNIAVVGKEEVAKGRHMNWIRVDRYFSGPASEPEMYFQPVPCMHCEDALCELVCPVAATVHSGEGLNEMVYNRCVGTRYCSNNCPYKVRRFNFLLYSDWNTQSLWGVRNPDVTVRSRGVMEKCSYCIQRINAAKIKAEEQNRPVRDGEIVTACQQACPAEAIVFGDLNDPNSKVARRKRQQRDYGLLEELNTHPRTTYLARLRNPNPEIGGA
jgi:molybdopterin-containing oxidoreductase family iron-sulfur binding subunit